jgi:hypothetical protein
MGRQRTSKVAAVFLMLGLAGSAMADWVTIGNNMYSDVSGNVGIGTTGPQRKLEISGPDNQTGLLITGTDSKQTWLLAPSVALGDAKFGLYDYRAASHRLVVDTQGNVGIGTTTPTRRLEIFGPDDQAGLSIAGSDSNRPWVLSPSVARGDGKFALYDRAAASHRLVVDTQGNVGIGTTTPTRRLVIFGPDDQAGLSITGSDSNRAWLLAPSVVRGDGKFVLYDYGTASHRLVVDTQGNVGIGTTNPAYTLDVEGYVQAKGYYTGDIFFQKDGRKVWRMFEDEAGLYVESMITGKKYNVMLQEAGNNGSADADASMAVLKAENGALKQKMADLETRLDLLAEKLQ